MPSAPAFSWKDSRVLVADDEPDMREIFAAWLRNLGCSVIEASDGKEAQEALSRQRFDAIVTDVRMPRVDGVQLARSLYESEEYTPVVIFISGFVDLPISDAHDLGVEAVLSKPCARKDLINALRRSMQRRHLVFEAGEGLADTPPEDSICRTFPDSEETGVAFGRGGMSLECDTRLEPGSLVSFSLSFTSGTPSVMRGIGIVRWRETIAERPRVGIEFVQMDEVSKAEFARWLQEASPASFIPKRSGVRTVSRSSP